MLEGLDGLNTRYFSVADVEFLKVGEMENIFQFDNGFVEVQGKFFDIGKMLQVLYFLDSVLENIEFPDVDQILNTL